VLCGTKRYAVKMLSTLAMTNPIDCQSTCFPVDRICGGTETRQARKITERTSRIIIFEEIILTTDEESRKS
jgi:hypothetical protein